MKTAALIALFLTGSLSADPGKMARVEGGTYVPMFSYLAEPRAVAPFLIDKRPVTLAALKGRPVLITMGYATCKFACPRLVSGLTAIRQQLSTKAENAQ